LTAAIPQAPAVTALLRTGKVAWNLQRTPLSTSSNRAPVPAPTFKFSERRTTIPAAMITDNELNRLAIFLGTLTMFLIVLYHFMAVNSNDTEASENATPATTGEKGAKGKPVAVTSRVATK
jgi:hypothetical protein